MMLIRGAVNLGLFYVINFNGVDGSSSASYPLLADVGSSRWLSGPAPATSSK